MKDSLKSRRPQERGLTLLEVIIVIGVLVMMMGLGLSGLNRLSSVQLRTQTNSLASAMRHAYNRSVAEGLYMRMVFDLDADKYWLEASAEPVFLDQSENGEGWRPDDEKVFDDENEPKKRQGNFKKMVTDVTMESGIEISGVLTLGDEDPTESGRATVHFFPNGFVEPAMIYTSDGEESFYTLTVHPLTGQIARVPGRQSPDENFGQPDETEEEGS